MRRRASMERPGQRSPSMELPGLVETTSVVGELRPRARFPMPTLHSSPPFRMCKKHLKTKCPSPLPACKIAWDSSRNTPCKTGQNAAIPFALSRSRRRVLFCLITWRSAPPAELRQKLAKLVGPARIGSAASPRAPIVLTYTFVLCALSSYQPPGRAAPQTRAGKNSLHWWHVARQGAPPRWWFTLLECCPCCSCYRGLGRGSRAARRGSGDRPGRGIDAPISRPDRPAW